VSPTESNLRQALFSLYVQRHPTLEQKRFDRSAALLLLVSLVSLLLLPAALLGALPSFLVPVAWALTGLGWAVLILYGRRRRARLMALAIPPCPPEKLVKVPLSPQEDPESLCASGSLILPLERIDQGILAVLAGWLTTLNALPGGVLRYSLTTEPDGLFTLVLLRREDLSLTLESEAALRADYAELFGFFPQGVFYALEHKEELFPHYLTQNP